MTGPVDPLVQSGRFGNDRRRCRNTECGRHGPVGGQVVKAAQRVLAVKEAWQELAVKEAWQVLAVKVVKAVQEAL